MELSVSLISNAVILSNAVYNAGGANGIASGFSLPIFFAYILCAIGTVSSISNGCDEKAEMAPAKGLEITDETHPLSKQSSN